MKRSKVIVINGFARSGKDTVCEMIRSWSYGKIPVNIWSTVDNEKITLSEYACRKYNPELENDRKFLSEFKALVNKYFNYTHIQFQKRLPFNGHALIVHSREPSEIEEFKRMCHDNGIDFATILVKNDRIQKVLSNDSDKNCENMKYDYVIENNSSLDDLKRNVYVFCRQFFEED